jgi:hypothetical protein
MNGPLESINSDGTISYCMACLADWRGFNAGTRVQTLVSLGAAVEAAIDAGCTAEHLAQHVDAVLRDGYSADLDQAAAIADPAES